MPSGRKRRKTEGKGKEALAESIVQAANEIRDPLLHFEQCRSYWTGDCNLNITCMRASATDVDTQNEVFQLVKMNMKSQYEQSEWGWRESRKRAELTHPCSWYLLAHDPEEKLVAVSHFRFETELSQPVLYCYELQVHPVLQRKGIGRFLMHLLLLIASRLKMVKVMLTTFKHNLTALNFYVRSLGFSPDETSPTEGSGRSYLILSKKTDKTKCCFIS